MKNLSEYYTETLKLIQPKFGKRIFELRSEKELLCTMSFPKFFSTNALVECGEQKWEIRKKKFWSSDLLIVPGGTETPLAKVNVKLFKKSIVELPRGEKILLKFGAFKSKNVIMTELENPLVTFKEKFSFNDSYELNIEYGAKQIDEYPWLIMLVLFLDLSRKHHSAAAH
jgi:hypothetical protein